MTERLTYEELEIKVQELTEDHEKYELITETIVHGVQEIDTTGKILFANSAFHKMCGYANGDLIGKSMYDLFPEDTDLTVLPDYIKTLIQEQPEPEPWFGKMVNKNGNILDIQTDWNYKHNRRGDVIGFISIISDITDRKKDEIEIEQSHKRLEVALEGSNSGIWEWNLQTNEVFFGENFFKMAGYEPDEFSHSLESFKERVHPDDVAEAENRVASYLEGKSKTYKVEFRLKTKSKQWMWILSQGKIFKYDEDGNPILFTGTHVDITYRKNSEQILNETNKVLEQKVEERTHELTEMNTALKVLLKKRETDKKNTERQIFANVRNLIIPYLKKLGKILPDSDQRILFDIINANVNEIISPISRHLSSSSFGLSLTEIKVANLIKEGKKSKEIASILGLSSRTIDKHRENIRRKLSINNRRVNLAAHLSSMD